MFSIFLLLNLNFTILRSIRNTLAVVDLGSGAQAIPFFELFGTMPAAFLMTFGLARLMNKLSIEKVFLITLTIFLGFFLSFAVILYPYLFSLKQSGTAPRELFQGCAMLFYVMSELWKPALAVILFWGLVNQFVSSSEAKKLYAPLMLGGSLGSVIAGPIITLCTSEKVWQWYPFSPQQWTHGFNLMITVVIVLGVLTGFFYYRLWTILSTNTEKIVNADVGIGGTLDKKISLSNSISACLHSPQLRLLSWIVIADYIAYSLAEVIFLDILKIKFPHASDYCGYLGQLALWSGVLTLTSSLFFAPIILQRYRWVVAALATPLCLLVTEGLFFLFLEGKSVSSLVFRWTEGEWVGMVVLLGSLQYCLGRATKYTLFDSSKELAFVLMPDFLKMRGKLVVDGLCARLGRGGASMLSLTLIKMSGGVIASGFYAGFIAIGTVLSWVMAVRKLGTTIDGSVRVENEEDKKLLEGCGNVF